MNKSGTGKELKRVFNEFIIEPLELSINVIEGNWEKIEKVYKMGYWTKG